MRDEYHVQSVSGAIMAREYDLIAMNFANPDMVEHTGGLASRIRRTKQTLYYFCSVNGPSDTYLRPDGRLSNIAPSLMKLLGAQQSPEMTGHSPHRVGTEPKESYA